MTASIKIHGGSFDGSYYMRLISYYSSDDRPSRGVWIGRGKSRLKLGKFVERQTFKHLLSGKEPNGRRWLSPSFKPKKPRKDQAKRRERASSFDVCFSVPKSVSALWAVADERTRRIIESAVERAVRRVIAWLEKNVPLGRRGKGGSQKEFVKLVCAAFLDRDSRRLQPQLHMHTVPLNAGLRSDGTWCALNSPLLHRWVRTLGPMFRVELMADLHKALGLRAELPVTADGKVKTAFELCDVPQTLMEHWSARSREAKEDLAGQGGLELAESASAKAKQAAVLRTRSKKQKPLPLVERFRAWRDEAAPFGFGPEQVEGLLGRAKLNNPEAHYRRARKQVLRNFMRQDAEFGKRDLIRQMCEALQHTGIRLNWLLRRLDRDLAQAKDLVTLNPRDGDARYTAIATWKLEKKLRATADKLHQQKSLRIKPKIVEAVIAARPTMTAEQAKALRDFFAKPSRLGLITGVAGAGKSFLLDAIRECLQRAGLTPIGAALSGVAAEELAKQANIPARTIASYLWRAGRPPLDQFKQVALHEGRQFLRAFVGKHHQKLYSPAVTSQSDASRVAKLKRVAAHEAKQLLRAVVGKRRQKMSRFEPAAENNLPQSEKFKRVVVHEVKQMLRAVIGKNRRDTQSGGFTNKHVLVLDEAGMLDSKTFERVLALAKKHRFSVIAVGDTAQLQPINAGAPFKHLVKQYGSVHLSENFRQRDKRDRQAVADLRDGKSKQALANYAERGRLHIAKNRVIAIKRLVADASKAGAAQNPRDHLVFTGTREEARFINEHCQMIRVRKGLLAPGTAVSVGAERFLVGDRVLFHKPLHEYRIRNGYRGEVVATNRLLRTISVRLDQGPLVTIPLSQLGKNGLTRGYAMTIHKGQGTTIPHAYVLLGGSMTDRETVYTQATRGKLSTRLYTDRQHAGPDLRDLTVDIAKSRQKEMAHDLGLRLQIERTSKP